MQYASGTQVLRLLVIPVILLGGWWASTVSAEGIVRDGTVGNGAEQQIQPENGNYTIGKEFGQQRGNNLFHSFSQFNLDQQETATFTGPAAIENVINRVTGPDVSNINGAIHSSIPEANVYLLNPNGIIFGPHAVINTQGAFFASTAKSLPFKNGEALVVDPSATPVLSIAEPDKYGFMGELVADIKVLGSALSNDKGITLQAASILLDDAAAIISNTGGDISVRAANEVRISNESVLESNSVSTKPGGSINIEGDLVVIDSGAKISTNSAGFPAPDESADTVMGNGGEINIIATKKVSLIKNNGLEARSFSTGKAGSINIEAPIVELYDATVTTSSVNSESSSQGGNIRIESAFLDLEDSTIDSSTVAENSSGGTIDINTDILSMDTRSVLDVSSLRGSDGTVQISSQDVNVDKGIATLSSEFLDASAHFKRGCGESYAGGRFAIVKGRGFPVTPEEFLLAFDAGEPGGKSGLIATRLEVGAERREQFGTDSAGMVAFRAGNFRRAKQLWLADSQAYARLGDSSARGEALRGVGQSQLALGEYLASVETLRSALEIAQENNQTEEIASILSSLGNAYVVLGQDQAAEQVLTRAIVLAQKTQKPELAAGIMNNYGNQHAIQDAPEKALKAYAESARLARAARQPVQEAKAMANGARVALMADRYDYADQLLARVIQLNPALEDNYDRLYILSHVAKSFQQLAELSLDYKENSLVHAYATLSLALVLSKKLDDARAHSFALGNLGKLYQNENRIEEALYVTRRALRVAEQADAPDALYRWYWQEGQLQWVQGNANDAILSYRRAVAILEETRQESLLRYGSAMLYFRQVVAPVYLDLVDALLQSASRLEDPVRSNQLVLEARATVEQLKAAELRNYFRNECVAELKAKETQLEQVSDSAAVIYPILLPDRIEILVSTTSGLHRFNVAITAEEMTTEIRRFRLLLEKRSDLRGVQSAAWQLYDWLIAPYQAMLTAEKIDTLVFVPDGPLRTIPLAALHDGKDFIIRNYSVVVSPGLWLTNAEPLDRANARLLLAGLSESVQGFPPLAYVSKELESIRKMYGGEFLLNENFTLAQVERKIDQGRPTIVHIASHGQFTGNASNSFILAYDGRLSMEHLSGYIESTQYGGQPLELLVLSACKTAAGDDRAALGLAGVGIKAGASSAMGTLWSISDEASAQLVTTFYQHLKDPHLSKAQALQKAQRQLLGSARFSHPFYWSPFLLINNWL